MPRFLDALRTPLIDRPRVVLELLEKEIGADFSYPEGDLHAVWQPRDIQHTVSIVDRGDFGLYLLYTAKMFDISDGVAGLEIASLLNRRQYFLDQPYLLHLPHHYFLHRLMHHLFQDCYLGLHQHLHLRM